METSRQTLEDMAKITSGAGASSEDEVDVIVRFMIRLKKKQHLKRKSKGKGRKKKHTEINYIMYSKYTPRPLLLAWMSLTTSAAVHEET